MYQQVVPFRLGVEKGKYKGGKKRGSKPRKAENKVFTSHSCYCCQGHMNVEPISADRRMGMMSLACKVKTWT